MADRWGVEGGYQDAAGTYRRISPGTLCALRELVGEPGNAGEPGNEALGALVLRPGDLVPVAAGTLTLEDGTSLEVLDALPRRLPLGYHRLHCEAGERQVIVSPGRCHLPPGPCWAWSTQLYAMRSTRSWGIGDLGDLAYLADWAAAGTARFVMVNPLHAVAPTHPQQRSPYSPASRRFHNPIYLRIEDVPGAGDAGLDLESLGATARRLNEDRRIDRDAVWRLKRSALEAIWRHRPPGAEFETWRRGNRGVEDFATWSSLADRFGPDWRIWPHDHRFPGAPAVAEHRAVHRREVDFFAWTQWLMARQIKSVMEVLPLIQDLPIGVDPGGADAWLWQDLLAGGASIGAPPDEFNTRGQDWGLLPFNPWRLTEAGYGPFIEAIRATMMTGGGLRVDHVMGMFRLWWIPQGAPPAEGGYVRYPAGDLLDIIALESHRAGALVVGEDLGTVEEGVREKLADLDILSYRLLWFEQDHPAQWPRSAMAAVTTHDLPTVAGLWDGSDLERQRQLGLEPNRAGTQVVVDRLAALGNLDGDSRSGQAVAAAYDLLAQAPCHILVATLDDALEVPERPNVPGAGADAENWSLALPLPLEKITCHPSARGIADLLRREGRDDTAGPQGGSPARG